MASSKTIDVLDQRTHGCFAAAQNKDSLSSDLITPLVKRRVKYITLNVLDPWDVWNIRLDMESSADGNMGTVKFYFLFICLLISVQVSHSMWPF